MPGQFIIVAEANDQIISQEIKQLFTSLIEFENIAAHQCNQFPARYLGKFCADFWHDPDIIKDDIIKSAKTYYMQCQKFQTETHSYCFNYHDGYFITLANNMANLKQRLDAYKNLMLQSFSEKFLLEEIKKKNPIQQEG